MRITKRELLKCLVLGIPGSIKAAEPETVSVLGKTIEAAVKGIGVTLVLKSKTWMKHEVGDHVFKTNSGVYVLAPAGNVVILRDRRNNRRVGQLHPLVPALAKRGDPGRGQSDESGITFDWTIG